MSKEVYKNRTNPFNKTMNEEEMDSNESKAEQNVYKLKQEIADSEQRQLDSTQRALASIADSEKIGIATAEELIRQGEQLDNIEWTSKAISQDLKVTQRQLTNIRGPFGWFKNWWYGDKDKVKSQSQTEPKPKGALEETIDSNKASIQNTGSDQRVARGIYFGDSDEEENVKSEKENSEVQTQYFKPISKSDQEQRLNENLNKMAEGMTRLKGLAVDMGDELDEQNKQLDRINIASATSQATIDDQTKQIKKLLK